MSLVIGEPEITCFEGSNSVKSGDINSQFKPSFVVLCKNCDPWYIIFSSCGEI